MAITAAIDEKRSTHCEISVMGGRPGSGVGSLACGRTWRLLLPQTFLQVPNPGSFWLPLQTVMQLD